MPKPNHTSADPRAEPSPQAKLASVPTDVTLLELVLKLGATIKDDREVAATARSMLRRGDVRLVGNFRGKSVKSF